jgi:hypothetical protein
MPDYTQTYIDTLTRTQETALNAASAWTEHLQETWDNAFRQVSGEPRMPNPVEVVNATFDNVEKVVGLQREFYIGVAQAYAPLIEQGASEAKRVAKTATAKS